MQNKKKIPLVSIVITNYNKSLFILKAINSCLNQKYNNTEIIFFDDKSSDDSLKKVRNYKKNNKLKLKIISNKKKKKFSAPINQFLAIKKSLKFARGEFISFLDADDYFHPKKISEIAKVFITKKTKIVLDQPVFEYENKQIKKNFSNLIFKDKWPKFPPTSCMSFERKTLIKVLKEINFKKFPNLAIDFYLAVYYSIILKNFYIHKSHLTYYRQLKDGTDSNYIKFRSKKWWLRRKEAFDYLNSLLSKKRLKTNKSLDYIFTNIFSKF
tara:strand:+ start:523 stop:1329 length:807 start_codon:yes stop_codon:yes gene_type:complete